MKDFLNEFLGWSLFVIVVGGSIWLLFWILPAVEKQVEKQHEEDCKTYIHPTSRSIYMGLHAEKACSHPDGIPRYLP